MSICEGLHSSRKADHPVLSWSTSQVSTAPNEYLWRQHTSRRLITLCSSYLHLGFLPAPNEYLWRQHTSRRLITLCCDQHLVLPAPNEYLWRLHTSRKPDHPVLSWSTPQVSTAPNEYLWRQHTSRRMITLCSSDQHIVLPAPNEYMWRQHTSRRLITLCSYDLHLRFLPL